MANLSYAKLEMKTLEQVQSEIDALPHSEFLLRLASQLGHIGVFGANTYYIGGVLTPMGKLIRAYCTRLARINGDARLSTIYQQDFANRDAAMKKDAEEAKAAMPEPPKVQTLWLDAGALKAVSEEMSISRALLSTYPISGSVPLRTLTPEELQALATTEL